MEDEQFLLARKAKALQLRAALIQGIRLFFINHGFLEIETPVRIPAPAPEENIEALPSGDWFLQTSPELAMKRMLAAGYPKVFQICKCFRAWERGRMHLPEFTMLEWYVSGFNYYQLMDQCEEMVITAAREAGFPERISWRGINVNLTGHWDRVPVQEAFRRYAPVTATEALEKDEFDEMLVEYIEPNIGIARPVFLYDYPAPLGALAKLKEENPLLAERFELYIAGVEVANGFSELTDADEQRVRFEKAQQLRAAKGFAAYPLPEKFLSALADLPACAGIALGIDRLAMLFTGATNIDEVVAFPPDTL